jgi:hypothetical protein
MRDILYSNSIELNNKIELTQKKNKSESISLFPSFIINNKLLLSLKEKLKNISWEKDGINLLSKISFTQNDIKTYKLLLLKQCIPLEYKGEFWYILSGAKKENLNNPNYYFSLLNSFINSNNNFNEIQIEKDINRTFIQNSNPELIKETLRNILITYSKRNLSIGYVQGFNFILNKILFYLPYEEKSFWLFVQIIENILPIDFFSEMLGMMSEIDVLICLIKEKFFPDLINKLNENNLICDLKDLILKWFNSLFSISLNNKCQNVIWDILFCDGKIVLFKSVISLLKIIKDKLILFDNFFDFRNFVNEYFNNLDDEFLLLFNLVLKKFEFDENFINYNKGIIFSYMKKNYMNNILKEKELYKQKIIKINENCDLSFPFCIYDTESKFEIIEFLTFTTNKNLNIIEDYCENGIYNKDNNESFIIEINKIDSNDLLIERKIHYCEKIKKKIAKSVTFNRKDDINIKSNNDSFMKSEEHEIKKIKYKELRKNKYYSNEVKNNNIDNKKYLKNFKTQINDDYEKFLDKINKNYKMFSMANIYILRNSHNILINNEDFDYLS